jgi:hypothetical protein
MKFITATLSVLCASVCLTQAEKRNIRGLHQHQPLTEAVEMPDEYPPEDTSDTLDTHDTHDMAEVIIDTAQAPAQAPTFLIDDSSVVMAEKEEETDTTGEDGLRFDETAEGGEQHSEEHHQRKLGTVQPYVGIGKGATVPYTGIGKGATLVPVVPTVPVVYKYPVRPERSYKGKGKGGGSYYGYNGYGGSYGKGKGSARYPRYAEYPEYEEEVVYEPYVAQGKGAYAAAEAPYQVVQGKGAY